MRNVIFFGITILFCLFLKDVLHLSLGWGVVVTLVYVMVYCILEEKFFPN